MAGSRTRSENGSAGRKSATAGGEAARLRDAIDSGETHDKVDYPDPAAAPLGTDEEAGGATAGAAIVHDERAYEEGNDSDLEPSHLPERGEQRGSVFLIAIGVVTVVVLALIGLGMALR
jgi:hypothetical protein